MMRQKRLTDSEAVRARLDRWLKQKKWSARKLALLTGDDPKNVQRYRSGETATIPADFIARCEEVGFVSAQWVLVERGGPEVSDPSEADLRLRVIGHVYEGRVGRKGLENLLAESSTGSGDGRGDLDVVHSTRDSDEGQG